jgi:hypothetical protein
MDDTGDTSDHNDDDVGEDSSSGKWREIRIELDTKSIPLNICRLLALVLFNVDFS